MKHRIGIYLIYDTDGIVDEYICYYLRQMKEVVSRIVVVCNGCLSPGSRRKLKSVTEDVFCRENVGFDAWGYKEALEYIGWDRLSNYEELVITNYTVFGPLYSLNDMFEYMDRTSNADFWGIHRRYEDISAKYFCGRPTKHGYMPEYPLSNFWVIRSSLLHSYEFKKYWDNLPPIKDYVDACLIHEPVFTKTMCDAGYIMDAYSPEKIGNVCPTPTIQNALYQMQIEKLPLIRRRVFFNPLNDFLDVGYGGELTDILKYIEDHTSYDTKLIWENIIRTVNQYDLYNRFALNYIISDSAAKKPAEKDKKIAVVIHIYYMDLVKECKKYLINFPDSASVLVTTTSEEKKQVIAQEFCDLPMEDLSIEVIPNRGRDVSSLLIAARDFIQSNQFDYVCFYHDKKMPHLKWEKEGIEFKNRCYHSIMGSPQIVENVLTLFEENPFLGLLSAPCPYHGRYYHLLGGSWTGNFANTAELAGKLGLRVNISEEKPPIAPYGTCFWFRPEALNRLFEYNFQYDDFPEEPLEEADNTILHAIERIYSFVVQEEGYYPAYVLSEKHAQKEIVNLIAMLKGVNDILIKGAGFSGSYNDMLKRIKSAVNTSEHERQEYVRTKAFDLETELDQIPLKILMKKVLKRFVPSKIWTYLRRKRWVTINKAFTEEGFEAIIQNERLRE